MASLPQIEQYLAANPELAARIKQQMEEAMAAVLKPNLNGPGAASSAAVMRAQEMLSMLSQQSLAALQQSSLQLLNQQQEQLNPPPSRHSQQHHSRADRDRERAEQQRLLLEQQRAAQQLLNATSNGSSSIREVGMAPTPIVSQNVSQSQQMAAQQLTENSLAEPLGNGIFLATSTHIQQGFANQSPPTLIVPPTHIPLYPGYPQVPGGPGYVSGSGMSKYSQLLAVIEEMSKDLRPTYSGSKTAQDRFKRGIAQARILLRECMHETNQSNGSSRN